MKVRLYEADDRAEWLRMRHALWPTQAAEAGAEADAGADANNFLLRADAAVYVAERSGGTGLAGFAEVGERTYAEGCLSSPVAFLEAWYVDPEMRSHGLGSALIAAVEAWVRSRGYGELASDALLEDVQAHLAHGAIGFEEVERSVKFIKKL